MTKDQGEERGKLKLEGARSERLKQRWREKCNAENNEVKRSQGRIREIGYREEGCSSGKGHSE